MCSSDLICEFGFLLFSVNVWNVAVYACAFGFQVLRIMAEERLLSEDPAYRDFAGVVRYRLIPGVF